MIVVKELQWLDACAVGEYFVSIQTILVSLDSTAHNEFKEVGKEVHLTAYRLNRIVESGIGVIS